VTVESVWSKVILTEMIFPAYIARLLGTRQA
jgi:hypothetical protein